MKKRLFATILAFMLVFSVDAANFSLICYTATDNADITVYVTTYGSKYHRSDCRYLWNSKHAITLYNAYIRNYDPCSVCDPPIYNNDELDNNANESDDQSFFETISEVIAKPLYEYADFLIMWLSLGIFYLFMWAIIVIVKKFARINPNGKNAVSVCGNIALLAFIFCKGELSL